MPKKYLTAQHPLPYSENNPALNERLTRANHATLLRSLETTEQLSTKIKAHLHGEKGNDWTAQMVEYLAHLRLEMLDLTQAQFFAGHLSREAQNDQAQRLSNGCAEAQTTLTEPTSPLVGALHFAQNHQALIGQIDTLTRQVRAQIQGGQPHPAVTETVSTGGVGGA